MRGLIRRRIFEALALSSFFVTGASSQVLPPNPPVATAATNILQTSFTANWNASTGATSYILAVATDSIFRLPVTGYNNVNVGNVLTFNVTGLTASTTYWYRLRASNAGGTSNTSNVIVVATLIPPPFAPKALAATNITQTSFTANWDTSTGATTYFIDVAKDTAFTAIVSGYGNLNVGNVQGRNVTGLAGGTQYFYRVRAGNAGGSSTNSNLVAVTTVVATPPPPVATAASAITQTSFTANWNASTGATSYLLDVATDSGFTAILSAYSNLNVGNVLARSVTGLAAGTRYFYRVRGSNVGGTSGSSNAISVTTVVPTPPPPLASAATAVSQTSFSANWNAASGATAYLIDVATDSAFTSILPAYNNLNVGNVLTWSVTGLAVSTRYYYRVRASNAGGTSGNSNTISVTTVVGTPPPPVATAASGITQTSFTANWNAASGATSYLLDVATDTNFTSILSSYNNLNVGNVLARTIAGLAPGTKYYYRVRGSNAGGTGGNSNVVSVTTVVATPPAPVATAATGIAATSFTANWNAAAGATTYFVDVATDTGFTSILASYNNLNVGNVLTRSVTGLVSGTRYFYRVRGSNAGGTSGSSNIVSVTTGGVPPPAPVLLSPGNGSTGQPTTLALSWSPSAGAVSYVVQVSTAPSFVPSFINDTAVAATTRQLTGLALNTVYYWRVAGRNQYGAGAFSSPVYSFSTAASVTVSGTVAFPPNPSLSDYRMVSVPGTDPGSVSGLVAGAGGTPGFDWRAFRFTDAGLLSELGGSDLLGIGEGIWLIRRQAMTVAKSSTMPALQANGAFSIPLHSGWNIIADPFNVPVRWADVRALNGLLPSDVIQGWSGSYAVDSLMEPFKGYFYYNSISASTFLAIPYPFPAALPSIAYAPPEIAWSLRVTFASADNTDSNCLLGVSQAAAAGTLDIRKPPLAFPGGELYFSRPGGDGKVMRFSTDFRPEVHEVEEWDIEISRPGGCTGLIRFDGIDRVPADYRIVLVSPDDAWPIDLRTQNGYNLRTAGTSLTLRLLIGQNSAIERTLAATVPGSYSLSQNYPNPFNPVTTIRYGLPQRSMVSLAVFNTLGQLVRQLVTGVQEAGYHTVQFDGSGLASGIYFYRIQAGGFVLTRRLLLLK